MLEPRYAEGTPIANTGRMQSPFSEDNLDFRDFALQNLLNQTCTQITIRSSFVEIVVVCDGYDLGTALA